MNKLKLLLYIFIIYFIPSCNSDENQKYLNNNNTALYISVIPIDSLNSLTTIFCDSTFVRKFFVPKL